MKKLRLTEIAPYSGKRVQPFDGLKHYMSTGDLKGDNLSFENVTFQNRPSRADITVNEGDILFAKMTNTNKALQIDKEHDGIIVSTGFSVHRPIQNILNGDYFLQFLKHQEFQRQKNKLCTGAIQSAISNTGIEKILVPVPEYDDQLHIANLLSKAENLISQRKESIRLLDEFLKSTFLEMFGDGKNFEWKYLEEIVSNEKYALSSGPFGSNLTSQHYTDKGVIILRGTNITSGKLDLSNVKFISEEKAIELKRSEVKPNDVVIIAVGSSGKALLVPASLPRAIMSQNFNKITPDKSLIEPVYLEFCINDRIVQQQFKKKITDTVRTFLSLTSIKEIKIPVPPIELQTQFAQIVEKTEALKTQYQQSLQGLENLYGSLSQQAFRGELLIKKGNMMMAAEPETIYKKMK